MRECIRPQGPESLPGCERARVGFEQAAKGSSVGMNTP